MKRSLILLACLASLSFHSHAQDEGFSAADYLTIPDAQQEIYVRRMLNGNKKTYGACTEGMTVQQVSQAFTDWVNHNPQYLQGSLFSSFTAALIDFCAAKNIPIQ
jgi:hypothetical protein